MSVQIEIHDLLLRRQASELVHRVALQDPEECRNVFSVPNIEGMDNTDNESVFYVSCKYLCMLTYELVL